MASSITELRRKLVEKKIAIRKAERELPVIKAGAEKRTVETAGGDEKALGPNEAARARSFTLALSVDLDYQKGLGHLHELQDEADRLQAEVDFLIEGRREREWQIRERLTDVLAGLGHQNGHHIDAAVDDIAEKAAINQTVPTIDLDEIPF